MNSIETFFFRGNTETGVTSAITMNAYTSAIFEVGSGLQTSAYLSLNSDGTISGLLTNRGSAAWHNTPAAGLGASYWAILTLTGGTLSYGTAAVRHQLTDGYTWGVTTSGAGSPRIANVNGTMEIWDAASGGNLLVTSTFLLESRVFESDEVTAAKGDLR